MTIEEAIKKFEKQLHSAMVVLDSGFGTSPGECDRVYRERKEMAEIALSALRQQETVANRNEPMTLDELRKMDGDPVWVEFQDGSGGCWGLVHITVFTHIVFANGHFCTVGKPYYGKTWLAYRQKPEEDDHEV